jgi:hypothetical protein
VGTRVITTYGSGKIAGHRATDRCYEVQLQYGVAFLQGSAILGAEELAPNYLRVSDSHSVALFVASLAIR